MTYKDYKNDLGKGFREGLVSSKIWQEIAKTVWNEITKVVLSCCTLGTKCHYFSRVDSIGKMELGSL